MEVETNRTNTSKLIRHEPSYKQLEVKTNRTNTNLSNLSRDIISPRPGIPKKVEEPQEIEYLGTCIILKIMKIPRKAHISVRFVSVHFP
jgi:hypothetical protein